MEGLINFQNELMDSMNKLFRNYKKDGPSRRSVDYVTSRLSSLDGYWLGFQSNHEKLLEFKNEDYTYFAENMYDKTKKFYSDVRQIMIKDLETVQREVTDRDPKTVIDWTEQPNQSTSKPSSKAEESSPADQPQKQIILEELRSRLFRNQESETNSKSTSHINLDVSRSDKLNEMMRKQQSNFKAFARTIYYIDLDTINEQWEFEDVLKSLQQRWSTIDSLHWDIDSELREDDEKYNQSFYKYEKRYQEIKRQINIKMWSTNHREKSTPQMDIPTFSGNYHQWTSFKDLFIETIHNNRSISNAQKMQFLKNKVRGEAEKLIQHLNISTENYQVCWDILNHRYNNVKLIFSAHLNNLLSIPIVQHQSYTQIKRLHDTTNECLNAIKNLGVDIKTWDPLIVHILSQKLDTDIHTEYIESLQNPRDLPTLKDFLHFLEIKFTSYESSRRKLDIPKPSTSTENQKKPYYKSFGIKDQPKENIVKTSFYQRKNCPVCAGNHGIFHCETFLESNADNKRKIIARLNLCKNCLYNHYDKDCFSDKKCRTCNGKHNTLVHEAYSNSAMKSDTGSESNKQRKFVTNVAQENNIMEVLLTTALIKVQSADGSYHTMRALIDQGSQVSLISENAAQILQLPRKSCNGVVFGIGAKGNPCKGMITITATSLQSDFSFNADLIVMKTLINKLPNKSFCKPSWPYLEGITLADPEFYVSRAIDLLLGADIYAAIIQGGMIKENESFPVAQQTRLGWILCGQVPSYQCNIIINNIDDIQRFWNIEDIAEKSNLSTEDQYCLKYYQVSTTRQDDGKYVVRLPLKQDEQTNLGISKNMAIAQFLHLEKKFKTQEKVATEYKSFIHEYIALGHMRECKNESYNECNSTPSCYLPHHCVQRADSTTTSLRVVFNASAKTSNGLSLNDIMFSGPNLQQDLLSLIIKWRQFPIAFTADVEKMFRQINLNKNDQKYQKIIWRDFPHEELREYALTTVTYGTKAAPFLAMMTLKQLAEDERHNYPEAAKVVEESFYMDDLLHGSYDMESAKKLQSDLLILMKSGGFNLRKWSSNKPELLEGISKAQDFRPDFEFKDQETTKTLGLRWNSQNDKFSFNLKVDPINPSEKITKRSLLSNISKIFDPLGWLAPVTTKLKLLFQKVVSNQMQWDDEVSDDIKKEWAAISQDLQNIKEIKVPRWLNSNKNQTLELHGYCDASTKAYACVIYCRITNKDQNTQSPPVIVAAKSTLVPATKNITLLRLELCAALLLSNLMNTVKQSLSNYNIKTIGWTDSTAVLGWLQGDPNKWKPFVTNRVKKITEIISAKNWNYVKSEENPADCASRGIKAELLQHHPLWWNGPSWLSDYNQAPDQGKPIYTTDQEIKTSKSKQCHAVSALQSHVVSDVINKYSCLSRATRVVAWVLRFCSRDQHKPTYLTTDELRKARNKIIKHVQEMEFADDINSLQNVQTVNQKSSISNLKPFLDQNGMLRVGGRLENANINWEMRHPLIIPHSSHLTELIIEQAHKSTLHGGARLTLAQTRREFWIVGGNRATKKRLRLCITCRKQAPTKMSQLMGDLPESRSNVTRPFYNTGIDYTGFVNVKANKGRGIKTTKGYIAVFVCMATKAVHLELVSDMSTESFLAALRRMAARRGAPRHIYSDNGTNFVGASRVIKKEYDEIKSTLDDAFFNAISEMNITWHFNAPSWPSAGGLWEAAVKSLKYHLRRVLGDQHLTFEEYSTLLAQIEACLNARPLCALSEDPDDIDYITPSHFLSCGPTLNIVETERDERTRWRLCQKIFQDLWRRWQTEYLCQLQSRSKWTQPRSNIKVGDVVIIHEANLPAGKWALGRVTDVHPGKDNYVRVVSVKTKNGIIKRPVIKLSVLPVSEDQEKPQPVSKIREDKASKQKTKIAPSCKRINFITMALTLFMMFMTPVQCSYNISYFKSDQGIYFDKISNMKLALDEWKLVVYYDINPYWQGSDLFQKYINHLDTICQKIKEQSQCDVVLLQLRHGYSDLNYYNSMLLGQRTELTRKKRGLINGIGNIAHSLFGVLDEQFAEQYQKDIEHIRINEKHLANLWRNQTSIIEAESNLLQRVENTMEKQHKIFNQHLNNLERASNQLSEKVKNVEEANEFTLSSIIANSILVNLKNIQDTLLDTITNVLYGKFNIHLLTPQQLQEELNIIAGQVSKDLTLPYENINADLPKLYQLMKVRTRMTRQFLIFEIKIPLVNRDTYELFSLIPIPRQDGKDMISIQPIANRVAINNQKELFLTMSEEDMQKCIHFDTSTLICPLQGPIYQLKSDTSLCVTDHITKNCKTYTDVCRNTWLDIHNTINTYFFFCCNQCTTRVICGQEITAEQLSKAGIIYLRNDCIIKGDSFKIFTQKRPSSDMNIHPDVVKFEVPSINNVINLSVPVISEESNNTDHEENQKYIKVINEQIERMKTEGTLSDQISYHDVHHYVGIYVVAGISLLLLALYVRRYIRHRRAIAHLISPEALSPGISVMEARRTDYSTPTASNKLPKPLDRNLRDIEMKQIPSAAGASALNNTTAPKRFKEFTIVK